MANFLSFIPLIQAAEGGYQKYPNDSGNYNSRGELVGTNYGVSAKLYEKYLGYPPTEQDMRNITKQEALNIFKQYYWDKLLADQINSQAVAETFVDMAINAGDRRAVKIMQRVLNDYFNKNLQIDGIMGPKTLGAINSVDEAQLFELYNQARENYYRSLSSFADWGRSWLRRIRILKNKFSNFFFDTQTQKVKKTNIGLVLLGIGLTIYFLTTKSNNE